jgi:hypothetical protein
MPLSLPFLPPPPVPVHPKRRQLPPSPAPSGSDRPRPCRPRISGPDLPPPAQREPDRTGRGGAFVENVAGPVRHALSCRAPSAALSLSLPPSLARSRSLSSSPARSRSGARDPRHSAVGNPNPSPRAAATGRGSPGPAPRRRSRSAAAALIEVGLARIRPEFAGSLPGPGLAGCESGGRKLVGWLRAVIGSAGSFFWGKCFVFFPLRDLRG